MKLIKEQDFPELQRDPSTGIWYVRKYSKGRPALFRSTKEFKNKNKAKQVALKLISEWLQAPVEGTRYTFRDVALEVVKLKESKSKATYTSARHHIIKRLIPFFGNYRVDQITEATVQDYFALVRLSNPEMKLFNDKKHLVMVLNRAYEKGLRKRPLKIKNPDEKTDAGKVYSRKEEARLLWNANRDLKLQILMGIKMGMRKNEILKLSWDKVDFENGFIRLEKADTKTRRKRVIPIYPLVLKILIGRKAKSASAFVFPSPTGKGPVGLQGNETSWQNCKVKSRVQGRFHDLRHTCATRMSESGMNPVMASRILGMDLDVFDKVYCKPSEDSLKTEMALYFEK